MPEGSVELDTPVMCWPAKTHIIVILVLHAVSVLAVTGSLIFEFATRTGTSDLAIAVLIVMMLPLVLCCSKTIGIACLLCCKSKCCYGYYAIITILGIPGIGYCAVSSFIETPPVYADFIMLLMFPISIKVIGGTGIVILLASLYCAVVLCKLSYCDRAGGGEDSDDLYSVDDDSKSAETLRNLTGDY